VPAEYPTIQSAVDAANPGDDIIVQKGTYRETIVVDKNVDLIGVDWPTIDGGTLDGDRNTIMIPYLGDSAGTVEGFIITGGGKGGMGHGINVWDSSPTIKNNKITQNAHVGIGVHGRPKLTSKTKIHDNHIYDNLVGVGNGAGGNPRIFNNHIYNNRIVGVGSRGNAEPRIEGNHIYGQHIGIGAREVASPYIRGNHIYENVCGIAISPVSTVRPFAGKDIIMENNLIFNNFQCGISVTSFNLSKVIIRNNTIDSNNHKWAKTIRGGGLVLGWPWPAQFTAVVENNIITNNKIGGLVDYTGTELFPGSGATVMNRNNDVWNNENDYVGCSPGDNGLSEEPLFASVSEEKNGTYYLSQRAAGQGDQSPCVDAGSDTAAKLGLQDKTTRTDKVGDAGKVDLGYHYSK
jgi:nitrous oxidase accessory protein NosD